MERHRSPAIMAQRSEPPTSLDHFPTPHWGTRALCEIVLGGKAALSDLDVEEPACAEGYMASALAEYFGRVDASDIYPYGFGEVRDFLDTGLELAAPSLRNSRPDWIITNPPFNKAEDFARKAIERARIGVALLCRASWFESEGRESLFDEIPLAYYAPFIGRLALFRGRLSRKGKSATHYAWFVWVRGVTETRVVRIPYNTRSRLERDEDWITAAPAPDMDAPRLFEGVDSLAF